MVFQRRYLVVVEVGHVFHELVEAHESLSMHDTEIMNYESPIMKPVDENFCPLLTHPLHPEKGMENAICSGKPQRLSSVLLDLFQDNNTFACMRTSEK